MKQRWQIRKNDLCVEEEHTDAGYARLVALRTGGIFYGAKIRSIIQAKPSEIPVGHLYVRNGPVLGLAEEATPATVQAYRLLAFHGQWNSTGAPA